MLADKQDLVKFLQEDADAFGEVAVTASSNIIPEKLNVWPSYVIPLLEKWASVKRRVVILTDCSSHAIPPSVCQGINQAFEDALHIFTPACGKHNKRCQFWACHDFLADVPPGQDQQSTSLTSSGSGELDPKHGG